MLDRLHAIIAGSTVLAATAVSVADFPTYAATQVPGIASYEVRGYSNQGWILVSSGGVLRIVDGNGTTLREFVPPAGYTIGSTALMGEHGDVASTLSPSGMLVALVDQPEQLVASAFGDPIVAVDDVGSNGEVIFKTRGAYGSCSFGTKWRAGLRLPDGGLQEYLNPIDTCSDGTDYVRPQSINADGVTVGYDEVQNPDTGNLDDHAFVWSAGGGGATELFVPGATEARLLQVNDQGMMHGQWRANFYDQWSAFFVQDGIMTVLDNQPIQYVSESNVLVYFGSGGGGDLLRDPVTGELVPLTDLIEGEVSGVPRVRYMNRNDAILAQWNGDVYVLDPCVTDSEECLLVDTDGDGIYDDWETDGIPYQGPGGEQLHYVLEGADPTIKDIFVEIDAMDAPGLAPTEDDLLAVREAFARAPVDAYGITLHTIIDETNLPTSDFIDIWPGFHALKATRFGTPSERGDINRLKAKAKVYRYCIFGRARGDGSQVIESSGLAEIGGNDFMVTLGHPRWPVTGGTRRQKQATFMHELGHTLGLTHFGPQSQLAGDELTAFTASLTEPGGAVADSKYNFKPNYYSIMNYNWQMPMEPSDAAGHPATASMWMTPNSWPLDYSRVRLPDLNESNLKEPAGLVGTPANPDPVAQSAFPASAGMVATANFAPSGQPTNRAATAFAFGVATDWNTNGTLDQPTQPPFQLDINRYEGPYDDTKVLTGQTDWPYLDYDFRDSAYYSPGASPPYAPQEITPAIIVAATETVAPACVGDFDLDGFVGVPDVIAVIENWGSCDQQTALVCAHDLDSDGKVGLGDFLELLFNWGPCD